MKRSFGVPHVTSFFLRSSESQSLRVVRPYDNMKERERERKREIKEVCFKEVLKRLVYYS